MRPKLTATSAPPRTLHGLTEAEYARIVDLIGRDPNDVELGMFGAMWSEHCSYKHSRALLGRLPSDGMRVVVGPGENAGAIDIGDGLAAVFKVESHNHPSAVEPYQGAATGVGGILRDIFTMGARPIALLNALRFGPLEPDTTTDAAAAARNRYLFGGVVAGIAGYGNCIGVPDVGGEIFFDASYSANPLVNAMCIGLAPVEGLTLGRAGGPGNALLLVGATTGRDGIQGASFASATLDDGREARRPAVQVGNPFLEKLLMEACLELHASGAVVAMQDLGAAGLTCALSELASRGGTGCEVDLDRVPRRERGMTPYEVLLSESQERMLLVARVGDVEQVERVFERYGLQAAQIGSVIDEPVVRCSAGGEVVCELPGRTLTDDAPRYVLDARAPEDLESRRAMDQSPLAARRVTPRDLLDLLASPNVRSRRPVWRRYDHMNGTNTVVGPGAGDAALLRIKGTSRALALAIDGPGRVGALDPRTAAAAAVVEGALNVACSGASAVAVTDCLNLGDPETPEGYWELSETVDGVADACRALGIPVVSGNVSLYNGGPDGGIVPTPVIGTVGLIEDRAAAVPLRWHAGDEVWLLGESGVVADGLAAAEITALRGSIGGRPALDLATAARLVALLSRLAEATMIGGAHDVSVGGLAVALARMALAANVGAVVSMPEAWDGTPTGALFGERPGRVLVAVASSRARDLLAAADAAGVPAVRLGIATGVELRIGELAVSLAEMREAYETPF
ncbi:MAG: phosphoribosylformylglycinamidine synthase subunit PurL [Candidatus Limnocylindria bacterium]